MDSATNVRLLNWARKLVPRQPVLDFLLGRWGAEASGVGGGGE